ncbi:MAG: hypothetical protein WBA17_10455 [Saprospiraceae bacterium]
MKYLALFSFLILVGCAADTGELVIVDLDREVINLRTFEQRIILSATDTLVENYHIVTLEPGRQVNVSTHAADVEVEGQVFRIAVVRPLNNYYPHNGAPLPGNFLLLTPVGQDTSAFAVGQSNFGLIGDRTYFQVDRHYYHLLEVAEDYGSIRFERMLRKPAGPLTASLNIRFRRFSVTTLTGEDMEVDHSADRDLLIFFWQEFPPVDSSKLVFAPLTERPRREPGPESRSPYPPPQDSLLRLWYKNSYRPAPPRPGDSPTLLRLDSLYRALRPPFDLVTVSLDPRSDNLTAFLADQQIRLPTYFANERTCRFLNCNSQLPYAMHVSPAGKVISHYLSPTAVEYLLRDRLPSK